MIEHELTRLETIVLAIPPERIALFKAIVESYDNLATLRTENPHTHHLKLYFAAGSRGEVEALIDALAGKFALKRIDQAGDSASSTE